jgi:hypothetical protein
MDFKLDAKFAPNLSAALHALPVDLRFTSGSIALAGTPAIQRAFSFDPCVPERQNDSMRRTLP